MAKITVREMALFAVLGALTFAAKYAMAWLPNIEPVSQIGRASCRERVYVLV